MRSISLLGRFCTRQSARCIHHRLLQSRQPWVRYGTRYGSPAGNRQWRSRWRLLPGTVILSALSPAAFVEICEEEDQSGETAEERMLEASRAELAKVIPDDIHGFRRLRRRLYLFFDTYIWEPLATGFRFLHLVIIFIPVIISVPAVWLGPRKKELDDERGGTVWWYHFLVSSMERAGPAFIKVGHLRFSLPKLQDVNGH